LNRNSLHIKSSEDSLAETSQILVKQFGLRVARQTQPLIV